MSKQQKSDRIITITKKQLKHIKTKKYDDTENNQNHDANHHLIIMMISIRTAFPEPPRNRLISIATILPTEDMLKPQVQAKSWRFTKHFVAT